MSNEKKISIIIPVYNNSNYTKNCLNDLLKLPNNYKVIIVNNASTDNSIKVISNFDGIKIINNPRNEGFAKACNIGYNQNEFDSDYVIFLNNDIRVTSCLESWPDKLLAAVEDGSLASPNGGLLDSNLNFKCETNKYVESPTFYLSGWCLAGKREVFDKLIKYNVLENEFNGPFEEAGKTYFDDTDLSFRAKQLNIPLKVVPIPVRHYGKATSKTMNLSAIYLNARGIFQSKWHGKI